MKKWDGCNKMYATCKYVGYSFSTGYVNLYILKKIQLRPDTILCIYLLTIRMKYSRVIMQYVGLKDEMTMCNKYIGK